ncbi:MAG: sigma-70 family RNA polymerase sigma factor [Gemmataceae bacterium]
MRTGRLAEALGQLRGDGLTDGQLLDEYLQRRDGAALEVLVRRHGPTVWGVCRRVLGDHHDAEDAFQATFLVLVRRAASVSRREQIAAWIYGVARQTARKARATARRRGARERRMDPFPEPAVEPDTPDDLRALLADELGRLPADFRAAVVLCDLEGRTRAEAARSLGVPEGTVASRLARGRGLLAARLARRGVAPAVPAALADAVIRGNASAAVAALAENVLGAMLMTKIRSVTALLLVTATLAVTCGMLAGPPGREGTKPTDPAADRLQGAWRLVTAEVDGLRIGEGRPEIEGMRVVFAKASFTVFSKDREGGLTKGAEYSGTFARDGAEQIVLTWATNPWNKEVGYVCRALVAVEGDTLRLCLGGPEGDPGKVPAGFSAPAGSKRWLWTFRREGARTDAKLWAGLGVNRPLFTEGDTAGLQLDFALVNDGD